MDQPINPHPGLTAEERQAAGPAADAVLCFRLVSFLGLRLRYMLDQRLHEDGLTTQQGVLLTIVRAHGRPTFGEAAKAMSTTYQNVKQVALVLVRKGMISIVPDEVDGRAKRLVPTKAGRRGWESRNAKDFAAIAGWFEALSAQEQHKLARLLAKLARHLS
ncbi:MAG: hypothetical protein F9K29_15925 [Hyphomicrobiaceae bacterium]|nr:MAG: hypothetical protein F9K29_15925 [Hyphomicrobiaceae bacterium]